MANDIDMWKDLEKRQKDFGSNDNQYVHMLLCYGARYIHNDDKKAEQFKNKYIKLFGDWGNWY